MEDIFKPSSLTIMQLFGNTDSLYQIPRYQRAYSWKNDQLDKLWDDIVEAQKSDPHYFLGSIITAKPEESSKYLDIVDGQQRLTTLFIMLCVCRNLYPNINSENIDKGLDVIDNNTIRNSIKYNDRIDRLRLVTHSNHQSDFDTIIINGDTSLLEKPTQKELRLEDEPKYKFQNTAFFFKEKLTEIGEEAAGELLNYIFYRIKIIRIDCQSVSFAIKLFQVLNDRGLDLSNSDLIKSFLIGKIQRKYKEDPEQKKQKEDQFIDDWKTSENYAKDSKSSMNDLLIFYEYYLLAQNPKKSLYDELVIQFKDKDPNEVMADIKLFIANYKSELYDKEDKLIYSFWYLRWGMYWKTILLTAITEKHNEYYEFAKMLRRYYYLNWIAGHTLTKIKQTSFNLIKWIKEKKTNAEIQSNLEKNLSTNKTKDRAMEYLDEEDIYSYKWCKPLFFTIEYNQSDNSNQNFLPISDRNIHIEHIVPRAYQNKSEWALYHDDDKIEDYLNSGGNLTLLSGSKNMSASNEGFDKKIQAYKGKGNYKKENEGITSFQITQKIVNDYNENKYNREWNLDALEDRWDWFCTEVEKILEIDLREIKIADN